MCLCATCWPLSSAMSASGAALLRLWKRASCASEDACAAFSCFGFRQHHQPNPRGHTLHASEGCCVNVLLSAGRCSAVQKLHGAVVPALLPCLSCNTDGVAQARVALKVHPFPRKGILLQHALWQTSSTPCGKSKKQER